MSRCKQDTNITQRFHSTEALPVEDVLRFEVSGDFSLPELPELHGYEEEEEVEVCPWSHPVGAGSVM